MVEYFGAVVAVGAVVEQKQSVVVLRSLDSIFLPLVAACLQNKKFLACSVNERKKMHDS